MNNPPGLLLLLLLAFTQIQGQDEVCPKVCTCETAALSSLPINSILVKTQRDHHTEEHTSSYQSKNEVLDEADEQEAKHNLGEGKLKAATCILQPQGDLDLFHSLSPDTQVLTILQGPGSVNITLDESYFQHLQNLVVLEIHGFHHDGGHLRLRNNALKQLRLLQYLNLQYVHLLGDRHFGNRAVPLFIKNKIGAGQTTPNDVEEDNDLMPEVMQLYQPPQTDQMDVVPYSVYREQQERAGLSTFAGLESLLFLRAFHCNIKEVSWEMFNGLQGLQYLSLEGNKIPFLHDFSFYGTPNLKHLILSHNKLLDIRSLGLAGLFKLETLDLSYNNISHLTEFSLPPLPALITADLHHNPLEVILPYTFQVLNSTQQLFLGGNRARLEFHPNSFLGLTKLHKLSINGVFLEVLERDYLKGMSHLRQIRVEGTIHELSFDAFAEVPKLQELILKNCSIRKISMDAFYGLYGLIYLDLSHNELASLPPSLFDHQQSLKEINLHDNKLTTLPASIFINTAAKMIRLDKNPWHCTCLMNEWQPSQINKVKVKVTDNSLCQSRYDKGSMCDIRYMYQYVYEQSVTPRCATPARYHGWSVFHLLRKHLRCDKNIYKHKPLKGKVHSPKMKESVRLNRMLNKTRSENNLTDNEQSVTSSSKLTVLNHTLQTPGSKNYLNGTESSTVVMSLAKEVIPVTFTGSATDSEPEVKTSSTPTYIIDNQNIEHGQSKEPEMMADNQHMWTERNKEKYKLLMKKEKSKKSMTMTKDKQTQESFKIHIDPSSKTKKMMDVRKKWEMKMRNTMENLNEVPKSEP